MQTYVCRYEFSAIVENLKNGLYLSVYRVTNGSYAKHNTGLKTAIILEHYFGISNNLAA